LLDPVQRYYSTKLAEHGPTARGVDWNDEGSQELRFEQLLKVCDPEPSFTVNDYGCGYGALALYLERHGYRFEYVGFDIAREMLSTAQELTRDVPGCRYVDDESLLEAADYTVASGIFNVKLEADDAAWTEHVFGTLRQLDALSRRGFSFNMLTSYSDRERMRPDLHYADPRVIFDCCKREFSRWVALLHDYGLYEFTVLVRKDVE
jgi:SAM-dependent methyltransferase